MGNSATKTLAGSAPLDEIRADQLRKLQRLAELGWLSTSLLHEISNPLTAILLHLEQSDDKQSLGIRHVRRNIQLMQRYVEAARQQVRQEGQPVNFYVRSQLDQVKRVLTPLAKRGGIRLRIETIAKPKLFGDPVKFQQIVANLVINAIDAYGDQATADSKRLVKVAVLSQQQWLIIQVTDWGSGITAAQLPQLFEPFYTTKSRAGHGLGIGLAMVKQYVETDFGGSIGISSSRQRGTQFRVKLRRQPQSINKQAKGNLLLLTRKQP